MDQQHNVVGHTLHDENVAGIATASANDRIDGCHSSSEENMWKKMGEYLWTASKYFPLLDAVIHTITCGRQ